MQSDLVIDYLVFAVIWLLPVVFIAPICLGMRRDGPGDA